MDEPWFTNKEARDYLAMRLALEELRLEYRELRQRNGNVGFQMNDEINLRIVILCVEYITNETMWTWLETCP